MEKVDINTIDSDDLTPLMKACKQGDYDGVKNCIEVGADINKQNSEGMSALHFACESSQTNIVKLLLENNANVNLANKSNENALFSAVSFKVFSPEDSVQKIIKLLLDHGADATNTNEYGKNLLFHVAANGWHETLKVLLENYQFDLDMKCKLWNGEFGHTVLTETQATLKAFRENLGLNHTTTLNVYSAINILLEKGANPNTISIYDRSLDRTPRNNTLLIEACRDDNFELAKALINYGADIKYKNPSGQNALMLTADNIYYTEDRYYSSGDDKKEEESKITNQRKVRNDDRKKIIFLLLESGIDVNDTDEDGKTALHYFCDGESSALSETKEHLYLDIEAKLEFVRILLNYGAEVNAADNFGTTPLMLSTKDSFRLLTIKLLLENGADKNVTDEMDQNAYDWLYDQIRIREVQRGIKRTENEIDCFRLLACDQGINTPSEIELNHIDKELSDSICLERTDLAGFIYVMINPSMKDILKIGKTTRNPKKRAEELSSASGVPEKFMVAYQEFFSDCTAAEKYLHTMLEDKGLRISDNREFFELPLNEVVKMISQIPKNIVSSVENTPSNDNNSSIENHESQKLINTLLKKAWDYKMGWNGKFQDYTEALKLFQKTSRLGSPEAYHDIARMYEIGLGVNEDISLALKYYKEAANRGHMNSYFNVTEIYLNEIRHYENAKKAFKHFIDYQLTTKLNLSYYNEAYNTAYYDKDFNSDRITTARPHVAFALGLFYISKYGFFKAAIIQLASLLISFEKNLINASHIEIDSQKKRDAINALNQLCSQYADKENRMREHRENIRKEFNQKYDVNVPPEIICDINKEAMCILDFLTYT